MKNSFKSLVFGAVLALASLASFGQQATPSDPRAPIYNYGSVSLAGIPTTAAATTTTVTNGWIDVRGMQTITLETTFAFSGSTTSNAVYTIGFSLDKNNVTTSGNTTWNVAGNGTTPVIAQTTITNLGSVGYLKLLSIQNTHASLVLTNTSFRYGIKRNSP